MRFSEFLSQVFSVFLFLFSSFVPQASAQSAFFQRGDINADGTRDIADAISVLSFLFSNGARPPCMDAADTNDSGAVDMADPIALLGFLFAGAGPLPSPAAACGVDPTEDGLDCLSFPPCGELPEPVFEVSESDSSRFAAHILFPRPRLLTVAREGETFSRIHIPGLAVPEAMGGSDRIGKPGVPLFFRLIAVPVGAEPVLHVSVNARETLEGINLYPQQKSAVDRDFPPAKNGDLPPPEVFMDPPFVKDEEAYLVDALYPGETAAIKVVGKRRDLTLAVITVAPVQYNPLRKKLILNHGVELSVEFRGSKGYFVTQQSRNPFESFNQDPLVSAAVVNFEATLENVPEISSEFECLGAEFLIITHPDFREAADRLREWKIAKGISTEVFETGPQAEGGIGTSNTEIRDFIKNRFLTCFVRPSYVLLLGDAEFIPTFYYFTRSSFTTGSDLGYSIPLAGDGEVTDLLDLSVARIPVDTLENALQVVDKIIGYEAFPPTSKSFYRRAAFPAYFQCCDKYSLFKGKTTRAFIENVELIRDVMIAKGYEVDRLYTTDTRYHPSYEGDPTPRRYFDDRPLPPEIGPESGFAWDADTNDVINAWNDGRFLIIHRDHGGKSGWASPAFCTSDVGRLENGKRLPVLFSIDCATGLFDNETAEGDYRTTTNGVYFLEALLRNPHGGVVGALGDTRNSPTWANSVLVLGFADALFPEVLPNYGSDTTIRRLADILNYGKLYMYTQIGKPQTFGTPSYWNVRDNNVLWHAFGDPTQEIWLSWPHGASLEYGVEAGENGMVVRYQIEGAVITALQKGRPLARARVVNGEANLEYIRESDPGVPIALSASVEGAVSVLLTSGESDPSELTDEREFGPDAVRITFEDQTTGETITDQYADSGVVFVPLRGNTLKVLDDRVRQGVTHSRTHSLVNFARPPLSSAGVPLRAEFDPAVRKVGMYIGNGDGSITATLTAYDEEGEEVFSVTRGGFGNDVVTFIGVDAGSRRIAAIMLNYGPSPRGEELDDLLFE